MSEKTHEFNIKGGSNDCASRRDASFSNNLTAALQGGSELFNWFKTSQFALHSLNRIIATGGETVWMRGTDKATGYPIYYVADGDNMLMIGAYYTEEGKETLINGTLSPDEPVEIGFSYMVLVLNNNQHDQTVHQIATYALEYAGNGIAEIEVGENIIIFIEHIAKVIKEFIGEMIIMAFKTAGTIEAAAVQQQISRNAGDAADSTRVEGEVISIENKAITADFAVLATEAVGLIFGLGELAATLTLTLLAKKIVTYARLYNNSDIPLECTVCYISPGAELISGPMLAQNPISIPALSPSWAPASFMGNDPVHYIDLIFCNTDNLKGVGYVLKAAPSNDFPGFNILVNVPARGDSSLYMSFVETNHCNVYWDTSTDQQNSLSMSTQSGSYTLKIATNQLSGKSPSPTDGELGYYYEHLIVFEHA